MPTKKTTPLAITPTSALLVLTFYFILVFALGTLTAVFLIHWIQAAGPTSLQHLLQDKGPDRFTRRIITAWAVILIPFLLRHIGWRGWRDCGWLHPTTATFPTNTTRLILAGLATGIISLGTLSLIDFLTGNRIPDPQAHWPELFYRLPAYAASALVVALLEETFLRGILFRSLARPLTTWPAAILTSLIFAAIHFIGPNPAHFAIPNITSQIFPVFSSIFSQMLTHDHFYLRFLNLALVGLTLCAWTNLTKTIWFPIGLHAGWVWIMKLNGYLTEDTQGLLAAWLGRRSDMTDSWLGTIAILLTLIIAWIIPAIRRKKAS